MTKDSLGYRKSLKTKDSLIFNLYKESDKDSSLIFNKDIKTKDNSKWLELLKTKDKELHSATRQKSKDNLPRSTKRNKSQYTATEAQNRAFYLANKLHNQKYVMFYMKVAWNLCDWYIDYVLERALKSKDPVRYFNSAVSREMKKNEA